LHSHTCVYIVCTIFTLLLLSRPTSLFHQCQPLPLPHLGRACSVLLFSNFVEEKT
jgi:hypothetical protein